MRIYPAIDIKDGSCVRLIQGSYDQVTIYEKDPVKVAKEWQTLGAEMLHVVDLDGARNGIRVNELVVKEIVKNIHIPVQLGGGIRDTKAIETYLAAGVSQVIIGTSALKKPEWLLKMIQTYKGKIIVGIDARDGLIATHGWESLSQVRAIDYIKELEVAGLRRIVYTDIAKDGMLAGPNFEMYGEILQETSLEVIASGGVTTLDDLKILRALGVYGTIVGKALYEGKLKLEEILQC